MFLKDLKEWRQIRNEHPVDSDTKFYMITILVFAVILGCLFVFRPMIPIIAIAIAYVPFLFFVLAYRHLANK